MNCEKCEKLIQSLNILSASTEKYLGRALRLEKQQNTFVLFLSELIGAIDFEKDGIDISRIRSRATAMLENIDSYPVMG